MSKFNPKIIAAGFLTGVPGEISYRLSMHMDSDVDAQGKSARIVVGEADDLDIRVSVVLGVPSDEQVDGVVRLEVTVHTGKTSVQLATVSVSNADLATEQRALSSEVQREFFSVMAQVAVSGPLVAAVAPAPTAALLPVSQAALPVEGRDAPRVSKKVKRGVAVIVLLGVGIAASGGVYAHFFATKPAPDIAQAEGFSDIQKKIEAEIRAGASGLQGQNVGIQTMRAMGLDPGKANTGCLVGVR